MAKPFPLQTLLELSQRHMDDAARRLGQLLAGEQESAKRLALLQDYRAEYHGRFVASMRNGIDRERLYNYQQFLGRLDDAIAQAQAAAQQSKQRTAAGQKDWLDKRSRTQAFDTLSQRHYSHQQSLENRREQKLLDEHTARRYQTDKA